MGALLIESFPESGHSATLLSRLWAKIRGPSFSCPISGISKLNHLEDRRRLDVGFLANFQNGGVYHQSYNKVSIYSYTKHNYIVSILMLIVPLFSPLLIF